AAMLPLDEIERAIRAEGRHPEDWFRDHRHTAALWLAAERKLAFEREAETLQINERAHARDRHDLGI
ncbi:MAG TPA: hypothetical protein VFZ89_14430, partial [Solirubrobacteraceae bacterium]